MMVELTYPVILDTIRTAGILIGIFYYVMTLRNTYRNRQATLFSSFMREMDTVDFRRRWREVRYDEMTLKSPEEVVDIWYEKPESGDDVMSLISFFSHMGWLVESGLLSIDAVIGNMVDFVSFFEQLTLI